MLQPVPLSMRILLVILALVLGLAFHSRNHQPVTLDFYTRSFDVPLSWAVVAALAVGAALGALAPTLFRSAAGGATRHPPDPGGNVAGWLRAWALTSSSS